MLLLFARRISAASIELLPRSRRAAVFPRWLHVRKLKLLDEPHSLFVVASAACVYETGLLLLFAYVRVAQYNIIRNTKQIQKQNSIKPNTPSTRTPRKCIIVYYFSRPAGLPVLAVTYNDT